MSQQKKASLVFLLLIFLVSQHLSAQSLLQDIADTKVSKGFEHSTWGIYAEFTESGEQIVNSDGHLSLAPASNLKLFSSAAALHFLGEDYRFSTSIYIRGEIKNGVLAGDVIIKGGGDPTLGSIQVNGSLPLDTVLSNWTSALLSLGIKEVQGSVIADDLLFGPDALPDYFPWIDMGNYYGASTSALTIHDNLYYLYFKPGKKEGDPAEVIRTYPESIGLTFINYMKTGAVGSGDNGYIYAAPKSVTAVLRGTVPAGVEEFSIKGSIPDPALFAATYFTDFMKLKNIKVSGTPLTALKPIDYEKLKMVYTTVSPSVKDIVYIINKKSFNLYADQLFKMIGVKVFNEGSFDKGADAVRKFLSDIGVSDEGLRLYDGSGLSRNDFITPEMMAKMLSGISRQSYYQSFYNSLGVAGDSSDLSSFKNWGVNTILANNLHIKSGTINGVHSHSGYVRGKSGRLISFSFIANNFAGSSRKVNEAHTRWLKTMAEQN